MRRWENIPEILKNNDVKKYYDILDKKRISLFLKRIFDILASLVLIIILSPVLIILSIAIKCESEGPVFFRQVRITQYGEEFRIHKFRTMCDGADKKGSLVTTKNDNRITKVGGIIRKTRLDEIPQLFDVLVGNMTFVGVRPEVKKYVDFYTDEMKATLLLPAGITSLASIYYKDEDELLNNVSDPDKKYIEEILPEKMKYNLEGIENFSIFSDVKILFKTIIAVIK